MNIPVRVIYKRIQHMGREWIKINVEIYSDKESTEVVDEIRALHMDEIKRNASALLRYGKIIELGRIYIFGSPEKPPYMVQFDFRREKDIL